MEEHTVDVKNLTTATFEENDMIVPSEKEVEEGQEHQTHTNIQQDNNAKEYDVLLQSNDTSCQHQTQDTKIDQMQIGVGVGDECVGINKASALALATETDDSNVSSLSQDASVFCHSNTIIPVDKCETDVQSSPSGQSQNPKSAATASDLMDVETNYSDFPANQENSSISQQQLSYPENMPDQQPQLIGPEIPYQYPSRCRENVPDQQPQFIGPQIPYQYPLECPENVLDQQPQFIGPQIPFQYPSRCPENVPDQQPQFIGPQIPYQYPSEYVYDEQSVQKSFIGPQIPENYINPETKQEFISQEPLDSKYSFLPTDSMRCVAKASTTFMKDGQENYLRGCKWSPDGSRVLTNSNDNILRTFNPGSQGAQDNSDPRVLEMDPSCIIRESGIVYDYCWFPGMLNSLPETNRVACCCPGSPVHLWNSQNGQLLSSYRAFDHCDEVTPAYSVSFSPDGSKLYTGYKNSIRVFDTEYSHHKCSMIKTLNPKTKEGHTGIVSCFSHGAPGANTFVTGSYSRHVGIYYSLTNELVCLIQGQQGGVTHIMVSPDGYRLYTGGRKDPEIVCWDMRNMGQILCTFLRDVQTNQRIYFDLSQNGRYLVSGNHDGTVQFWDTLEPGQNVAGETIMKPCYAFQAHSDCTNGVSFNHHQSQLATSSGQRHFKDFDMESDSDSGEESDESKKVNREKKKKGEEEAHDFSLKIWDIPGLS